MRSRRRRRILPWERRPDWRRFIAVSPPGPRKPARRPAPSPDPAPGGPPARWRALALALAAIEIALLGWLAAGRALPVRRVQVEGNHWQPADQVVAAAGLRKPGSILTVDADSIRQKLSRSSWIRSSSVTVTMPDRVLVRVEEWQPVASFRAGADGRPVYLSSRALVLADGRQDPAITDIQGPAGASVRVGDRPVDPQLLTAMVNIQRNFGQVLPGQAVRFFEVDGCGSLTLTSVRGWRLIFGRVLTPEEYALLAEKVAGLRSIRDQVDFNSPDLDYINLENPSAPAVKLKSARPPTPPPTPTPAPGAKPTPTPAPTPSPVTIEVQSCR